MAGTTELLHRGGAPGGWGNLGLWPGAADYASACRALALRVGTAARLQSGDRVLSIACGAGEELRLWREHFGITALLGVEPDAALARIAATQGPVLQQSALTPLKSRFDAVLCVDAAYHLTPRPAWLRAMAARLRRGGRIAFTDLVLARPPAPLLRRFAAWCGIDADDLAPADQRLRQLAEAGFAEAHCEMLTDEVIGGFARFVAQQSRRLGAEALSPAWRRPAATALMIAPARTFGLGYALFSATKR